MKIILGNDHAGFELKQAIKNYLKKTVIPAQAGILPDIIDIGCDSAVQALVFPLPPTATQKSAALCADLKKMPNSPDSIMMPI